MKTERTCVVCGELDDIRRMVPVGFYLVVGVVEYRHRDPLNCGLVPA